MSLAVLDSLPKSRLKALLDHFGRIGDPRQPSQVAHPLPEVLLLVVCGTICDCESYELIAEWVLLHFAWIRQRGSCVFAGGRGRRGHSLGA